ncbi:Pseudouridine synthase family protein [Abeliophyllum distichum]|uniref:tRNA pseudouridine(55) synthase n=1 Tax=Abeliophyllum distichum TaxID=126358 RepID=A0ABD1SU86_9LAMI
METKSVQVRVKNLKEFGSQGWALIREGEAEKQKQYTALVWISRPLNDNDVQTVSSLKATQILQKTPVRVLHRRSPLEREKIIHWMKIERIAGSSQYFLLHLCTQAGTYIKEFVHGDLGRTHPSIGSIFGCRAEILQLDVTDVKMDCLQA